MRTMTVEKREKTGTREWSEHSANLFTGCSHGCRYCYARADALRFKKILRPEDWRTMKIRPKEQSRVFKRRKGVTMFPTTHDITPETLDACTEYLKRLLAPGNRVLIVTKAHLVCVEHLCKALEPWREQIEWRFTIGAIRTATLKYWEPGAPGFSERWCAAVLAQTWARVSFSIEPILDIGAVVHLAERFADFGTVWIGKMNQVRRRVAIVTDEDERRVRAIEEGQTDEMIMELVRALKDVPQVRWKDSIRAVMARHGKASHGNDQTHHGGHEGHEGRRDDER